MTMTISAKPKDVEKKWHLVDADGLVVGRLASQIAKILRGKHKPIFTPHIDTGDYVVVVNAEKVRFTGRKWDKKLYFWHTGYAGGIKERKARTIRDGNYPERILEKAVERMMPKESPLARGQLTKLFVYKGSEHPHAAQNPVVLDIAAMNPKNKRA